MAQQIRQLTATIPANTAQDDPYVVDYNLATYTVVSVDLEVPPGPHLLMGFYLALGGTQVIPIDAGEWINWDNQRDSWDLQDYTTAGTWSIVGYNLDAYYGHSVVARFHVNLLNTNATTSTPALTIVQNAPTTMVTL